MTVEYSITVPVILFIVAFCICFMLRTFNIAVMQIKNPGDEIRHMTPVNVIRITDVVCDTAAELD